MKYECQECKRIFSEPEEYVASCLTCLGECDCSTDGDVLTGCPWCGPQVILKEVSNE